MRRTSFVTLLGGAACLAARGARAAAGDAGDRIPQQRSAARSRSQPRSQHSARGLAKPGYVEGRNIAIEYRLAPDGNTIGCRSWPPSWCARRRERDRHDRAARRRRSQPRRRPRQSRSSSRMARRSGRSRSGRQPQPAGRQRHRASAFCTPMLAGKAAGAAARAGAESRAVLRCWSIPTILDALEHLRHVREAAARALGLQVEAFNAGNSREIDTRLRKPRRASGPTPSYVGRRPALLQPTRSARRAGGAPRACRRSIQFASIAEAGGLMSYGTSVRTMLIASAASMSAASSRAKNRPTCRSMQPTKFELVINLQDRQGARPRRAADRCSPAPTR